MAKLYNNIVILGLAELTGGQSVKHKTRSGKTLVADNPMFDKNRKYRKARQTHLGAIREAATYANFARTHEVYIHKARRTDTTAYSTALTDWFEAPRVLEINVDDWTGETGQTIRVKARDNVMVARVTVVIRDAEENVLEMGEAVQSEAGSAWWNYTTQSQVMMAPFPSVEATAQDLPGNSDSFVIS